MLFNSYNYLFFFPIAVTGFFLLPGKMRRWWLLAASLYFYMSWNPKYLILMLFSIVTTWVGGLFLGSARIASAGGYRRKLILAGVFTANLSLLFFFKYFDFALSNVNRAFAAMGLGEIRVGKHFLLPVGISFYTFQALGYIVDVYRGDLVAERNLADYALFVSFFPQLVAGPIERSTNLLPQIKGLHETHGPSFQNVVSGLYLILWGLFQKMVIADRVAVLVNHVFSEYYAYGSIELILAALGFSIQIYCDFASYSLIAMGSARIIGIQLMENFNTPYFARSIKEFWRRWHVSLSKWFTDYLYIPLGGNRCSKARHYLNILLVFLVSGLWHGASWTYVAWGLLHGVYQVVGEITRSWRQRLCQVIQTPIDSFSFKLGQVLVTMGLTMVAWIFFRASTIGEALGYIRRVLTHVNLWVLFDGSLYTLGLDRREIGILLFSCFLLFLVDLVRYMRGKLVDAFVMEQCIWFQWLFIAGTLWLIFVYGQYGPEVELSQFIYFQF